MGSGAVHISRRRAVGLLVAAPAATCLGVWGAGLPDFESQVRRALADLRLSGPPARFELVRLDDGGGSGRVGAVVRMIWAPGTRQYRFTTSDNADPAALIADIRNRFGTITAGRPSDMRA